MSRFSASRLGLTSLRRRSVRRALPAAAASRWADSTQAELAWERSRGGSLRWSVVGAILGGLLSLIVFAPAAWLADAVGSASGQRFQLVEARGTIWSGSAVTLLTGGPGSRDAKALAGRLSWSLVPAGFGLKVQLSQPCCLSRPLSILLQPGLGRWQAVLQPLEPTLGRWPSSWLSGLGTPWNTLQLGGSIRVLSSGFTLEWVQGRWRMAGGVDIELLNASSRLSTLDTLGSYRLSLRGSALNAAGAGATENSAGTTQIALTTLDGALQMSGSGNLGPGGLHFQGEAHGRDADDASLANLLSLIGRREGARSVISIG